MSNREFDLSNKMRPPANVTVVSYDVSTVGQSGARTFSHPAAEPGPLPSDHALREFVSALQDSRERKRALWRERGIMAATARRYGIGWDGGVGAWVLPVRDARGKLANVTTRPPRGGAMWGPGGRTEHPVRVRGRTALTGGLPLYPAAPSGRAWVLCAGEWDALVAIQAGLPAVTGLCGCRWLSAWDTQARGKRIAVAYDCGEEKPAALTVEHLRAAGAAEAWVVALGLGREGADVCDWFRPTRYGGYGRTRKELVQLIRDARP